MGLSSIDKRVRRLPVVLFAGCVVWRSDMYSEGYSIVIACDAGLVVFGYKI